MGLEEFGNQQAHPTRCLQGAILIGTDSEKNGTMVPNIGNHQGRHLLEAKAAKLNTRGGKRVHHVMHGGVMRWIHEDAHVPCQQMVQLSLKRHRGEVDQDEDDDSGAEN